MMQSRTWKNIENSAVEKIKAYFLENGGEEKEAWMEKINLLRKTNIIHKVLSNYVQR